MLGGALVERCGRWNIENTSTYIKFLNQEPSPTTKKLQMVLNTFDYNDLDKFKPDRQELKKNKCEETILEIIQSREIKNQSIIISKSSILNYLFFTFN